jgi:5-(carboxyamino)imidazole ribonucleotide synthase
MLKSLYHKDKPFTLGILGGGQLAKMLASAAYRLGINVSTIENHYNSPAGDMTQNEFGKGWENANELEQFIESSDIITLENEFIDPKYLHYISKTRKVFPSAETMELVQDKFIQKTTFKNAGLPVPVFEEINSIEDLINFGKNNGYPFVIKARKYGYDGYGNATVFNEENTIEAWNKFNNDQIQRTLFAESFVDFSKELAVIVARNTEGETEVYPCAETIQYRHICHEVIAPAEIDEVLLKEAKRIALNSVIAINGVGVFGVEMFLTRKHKIVINEIAPRPHNSGHYTIEACFTSQYENTIRAICGLPLGSSSLISPAACMVNLLGQRDGIGSPENISDLLRHSKIWLHLYNKKQSRIGRKMGHITAIGNNHEEACTRARSAASAIVW